MRAQKFQTTVLKPFVKHFLYKDNQADNSQPMPYEILPNHEPILNTTEFIPHNLFYNSRIADFNGLMNRGVFKVVQDLEAKGNHI